MKLILFLISLSILHQTSADDKPSSDPVKETVVPLIRDKDNYSIQITIANKGQDSNTAVKANALVSLSSNYVVFADDQNNNKCFNFQGINAQKLPVTRSTTNTADITVDYFNKKLVGKTVNSVTTMQGDLWKTTYDEVSVGATTCTPSRLVNPETYGKVGFIGLSADEDSGVKHFGEGVNSFGVYIPQEAWIDGGKNQDGKLIFNPYLTAKKPTKLYQRLPVYSNWTIPNLVSISATKDGPALDKYFVAFDINTPYIGLPEEIHEPIMTQLASAGLTCEVNDNGLPDCQFTGDATKLPMITIKVNSPTSKNAAIMIAPDMYVNELANGVKPEALQGKVHLNLQSLQTEISKLEDYENPTFSGFIILGQAYLRQRYVVFEITTSQALIYERLPSDYKPSEHKESSVNTSRNGPGEDSDFGKYFKYVLLAIGIIVVFILIWCLWNRKSKKDYDMSLLNDPNSSYVSIVRG